MDLKAKTYKTYIKAKNQIKNLKDIDEGFKPCQNYFNELSKNVYINDNRLHSSYKNSSV